MPNAGSAHAAAVGNLCEAVECVIVLGDWDFHSQWSARVVDDYQRISLDRLAKLPGVSAYRSSLVVTEIKRTTVLPV